MRMIFSITGLLIVVAVIGAIAKKQLAVVAPSTQTLSSAPSSTSTPGAALSTPRPTASEIKQSVETMLQTPRPGTEEK